MPPKKRQRTSEDAAEAAAVVSNLGSLDQIDSVVGNLLSHLQPGKLNVEKLKDGLFALKGIQNSLFADSRETETAAKERKAILDKKQQQLQGLHYEQSHLQTEIKACQNFKTTYLEKIVADEQGESIEQFLKADVNDPANKQDIVLKLKMEINGRGTLHRDLQAKQKKLASLQDEVKKKKSFLQSLPNHIANIERASMSLQKAMYNSDSKTKGLRMNGTERRSRLEAAQSLSLPLFTLFSSLQQYLDQSAIQDEAQALSLSVNANNIPEVLLHIPIVDSNHHGRPKKVTVHFQFAEDLGAITAVVTSAVNIVFQENVLEHLFPVGAADASNEDSKGANVFSWCNYLAGLHHVERNVTQKNIRAIVRVLCRRVRANATLKTILSALQRNQIPLLPEDAVVEGLNVSHTSKLSHFVAKPDGDDEGSAMDRFKVGLRKDSEQLNVQVDLHTARYPELPPKWTLNIPQDGQPHLYDERLAGLERKVNVELLASMEEANEVSHEWILLHQLHCIMEAWDSW